MLIYYSGSVYSGGHPEELLPRVNIMLTFHEIHNKIAKQDKRMDRVAESRKLRTKK